MRDYLEFEKPLREVEEKIEKLAASGGGKASVQDEIRKLRMRLAQLEHELALTTLDDAIDDLVLAVAELWELTQDQRYRVETVRRAVPKVGRNDPCPCGSGRKYKACHGG